MNEHPSLKLTTKVSDEEAATLAKEYLEPFQKIVESRQKLKETEEELRGMITALAGKIDSLGELKKQNMELEREVLNKIKAQL